MKAACSPIRLELALKSTIGNLQNPLSRRKENSEAMLGIYKNQKNIGERFELKVAQESKTLQPMLFLCKFTDLLRPHAPNNALQLTSLHAAGRRHVRCVRSDRS